MSAFSVNQVNQFYVVSAVKSASGHVAESEAVGTIKPFLDHSSDHLYFEYKGAGGVTRTDLIDLKTLKRAVKAASPIRYIKKNKITITNVDNNSVVLNPGQSHVLRIKFNNFIGNSIMDNYWLYADVTPKTGVKVSEFYVRLACSLVRNMAREASHLLDVCLVTSNGDGAVLTKNDVVVSKENALVAATKAASNATVYTGVVIKEHVQDFKMLGCGGDDPVDFTVVPLPVHDSTGAEVEWATITDQTATSTSDGTAYNGTNGSAATYVNNGVQVAEMEYFFMGERGDQERMQGWPNIVPTKYLADRYTAYDVLNIRHAFTDEGTSVQRSEKDMTIVGSNAVITALNTAITTLLS